MSAEQLKCCPFCGHAHALKLTTAQELAEDGEVDPEPWMHSDSWAVMCDASSPNGPGGCGASGGFFPTEAEAVRRWNARADAAEIDALRAEVAELDALRDRLSDLLRRTAAPPWRCAGLSRRSVLGLTPG